MIKKEGYDLRKKPFLTLNANYYLLLFILIIFTAGLSFLLMPLVLIGKPLTVYSITLVTGIVFGLFITIFVMDLDELTHHHHAGIWAIMLFGSIINFVAVYLNKNIISSTLMSLSPENPASPVLAALIFAIGFFIPYNIYMINQHRLDKSK